MQNDNSKFKTDLKDRCFQLSIRTIQLVDQLPPKASSRVIANQILRSVTSIGANLVEGRASSSRLEFKKFHEIALKSANESKYWLELLYKSNSINESQFQRISPELEEITKMIAAGVIKLKNLKL